MERANSRGSFSINKAVVTTIMTGVHGGIVAVNKWEQSRGFEMLARTQGHHKSVFLHSTGELKYSNKPG